ncbi:MAG: PA2779 family protein [Gammaproteobacteria bacterium]|nr:PA2779 family protein [Gammaproteobacteria bacterium]
MRLNRHFVRCIVPFLSISMVGSSLYAPAAQAALVETEQVVSAAPWQRAELADMLQRQDLAAQFATLGVDPTELQARIAALSDTEVAQLHGRLQTLPAGSGVLEVALFVFLVLLVTDILGFTHVFPFVKKRVR